MGSGKTTTANMVYEMLIQKGKRVICANFADSLKKMVAMHYHFPLEKCYKHKEELIPGWHLTIGQTLQAWGEKLREIHPDIFLMEIKRLVENYDYVIVGDVRYKNEVEFIQRESGKVVRLLSQRKLLEETRSVSHASETALDDYKHFDLVIDTDFFVPHDVASIIVNSK